MDSPARVAAAPGSAASDHIVRPEDTSVIPFPIPGATDTVTATVLNLDAAHGPPAIIVRMSPGTRIPAHRHLFTAETHYVLEGEFINAGVAYGPGALFTHAAGAAHGPHETRTGCAILTVQPAAVDASDFHIVSDAAAVPG